MFKILFIFLILFLAGVVFFYYPRPKDYPLVKIGNNEFKVQVVSTPEEKTRGLAGHKSLSDNEGMFFIFEKGTAGAFWMKGMNFPIDIIWIKDNKVSYIVENAPIPLAGQTDSDLPVYSPTTPSDGVLEINAGLTKKYKIKVGDKIEMNF